MGVPHLYCSQNPDWIYPTLLEPIWPTTETVTEEEMETIDDTILVDATTTYIVVGDVAEDIAIQLAYAMTRDDSVETGTLDILYDGSQPFLTHNYQDNGNASGVTFDVDLNGGYIRLVATLTSTGYNATFKANVQRVQA